MPLPEPARGPLPAGFRPGSSRGFLRERAVDAVEQMDRPDCDPGLLRRTYAQFPAVNAVVAGWRRIYREQLRPRLLRDAPNSLLDIGSGGGDIARSIARWAHRDGFVLRITAIDPDPRAHAFAAARPESRWRRRPARPAAIAPEFRRAFSADLVAEGARFDLVISNHVLHHLDRVQLAGLLADSQLLARRAVIHADIRRSPAAYLLFAAGTWPFFHRSYIRADGLTSIRRSYTAAELRAAVPPDWTVRSQGSFVNLLIHSRNAPDG